MNNDYGRFDDKDKNKYSGSNNNRKKYTNIN